MSGPRNHLADDAPLSGGPSDGHLAFREIFLVHTPPAGAASLRQAGRYMFTTALESLLEGEPGPPVAERARALAEDLRYSAHELARLESESAGGGLTVEETALAMKAGSWAREVSELVRALEAAVGGSGGES